MPEEEKIGSQGKEEEKNMPQDASPAEENKDEEKPEISSPEEQKEEGTEAEEEEKEEQEAEEEKKEEESAPPKEAEEKEGKEEIKEEPEEALKVEEKAEETEEAPKKEEKKAVKKRKKKEEAAAPAEKAEEKTEEKQAKEENKGNWYVVQTFSGQEDRVKESIARNVESMNMQHKIFKVLVPEEETVEIKGGKRIEKVRKMFPGYVFIEMILDEESWYVIRGTPGVAKFIGTKIEPTPVSDKEMQRVLKQIGIKEEKLEAAFDIGESVRIISGPFRGYTGSIDEVNAQKGKLKTLINIFGRDTPVEVNFEQVQKIT